MRFIAFLIIIVAIAGIGAWVHQVGMLRFDIQLTSRHPVATDAPQVAPVIPIPTATPVATFITPTISTIQASPNTVAQVSSSIPADTPIPTDEPTPTLAPTSTSVPAIATTPNISPIPTPTRTATPIPTLTPTSTLPAPSPTPIPAPIMAEITTVSFVGTGYTLDLRIDKIPHAKSHEMVRLVVTHSDGTVQEKHTQFMQIRNGDYIGAVVVDREQVANPDPEWVKANISIEVHLDRDKDSGQAVVQPPDATRKPAMQPTATPRPANTPPPTATPDPGHPAQRHIAEKRYMLELINVERKKAGVPPVVLGDNKAAQLHAESSLASCVSSHWGNDGLKPYMRYSLAGGYQVNGENGLGLDYCVTASDGYAQRGAIKGRINSAVSTWMGSPGHRKTIVDPDYRKVNIGLAWDRYNESFPAHFEGDYVEYQRLPAISNGVLSLAGKLKGGIRLREDRDLSVQIWYDRPTHRLTAGQLARTYCYDYGRFIASLRQPLSGGYYWPTDTFTTNFSTCPSPYDVPATTPAARSYNEAQALWLKAYQASNNSRKQEVRADWITAQQWTARGQDFAVEANIHKLLAKHRKGVYTIMVWAPKASGERVPVSQYSIFHGVTPPATYGPSTPAGNTSPGANQ